MVHAEAETSLPRVRLAFAFDVSGSMGQLDFPYHDPERKWKPIVSATRAFFESDDSAGISASLTFFPLAAPPEVRCALDSYETPDVPMTVLPSTAFGQAIDAITPMTADEWRPGTPTLAVLTGTIDYALSAAADDPEARTAVVLVSDGYPEGCDDNSIESVEALVQSTADRLPVYVIGVANPPGGPDTVSNLNGVAVAGGTEQAFIVATEDPESTQSAFTDAVQAIRRTTLSCEFSVPDPPDGLTFDPNLANVSFDSDSSSEDLGYDPTCESPGAWRYDDPDAPTKMALCEATCDRVRAEPGAKLVVSFGCTRRDIVR